MSPAHDLLAAAKAHLAARATLQNTDAHKLSVDDPRFAAVLATLAVLEAAAAEAEASLPQPKETGR